VMVAEGGMDERQVDDLPGQLSQVLDELCTALREGRLAALEDLGQRLEDLGQLMPQAPPDADALAALAAHARMCGRLLEAAAEGVRLGLRRVQEVTELRAGRNTYGDDGRRRDLRVETSTFRRL